MTNKLVFIKNNFPLFSLLLWLVLPVLNWNDLQILIHDNLDSPIVIFNELINIEYAFKNPTYELDYIFNGVPRFVLKSEFFFYAWLYKFFDTQTAYYIHYCIVHLIAFFGMYLLLVSYVFPFDRKLASWIALLFSLLPFWTPGSLAVAGFPIISWALFNLFNKIKERISWTIVILFNFFSPFFFSSVWFYLILVLIIILLFLDPKTRSKSLNLIIPAFVLVTIGIAIEYRMFYNQLFLKVLSHRVMWNSLDQGLNFFGWVGISARHFFLGHYHFHSLHLLLAVFSLIFFVTFIIKKQIDRYILALFILILLISCIGVAQDTSLYKSISKNTPFQGLNLRFFSISPFFWYLFFSVICLKAIFLFPKSRMFILLIIYLQACNLFFGLYNKDYFNSSYAENLFYSNFIKKEKELYASINSYYMTSTFHKIKKLIPLGTRLACINVNPEVARINGFKSVGAYYVFIPLEKRILFNKILKETDNNNLWDSRAYLRFDNELGEIDLKVLIDKFNCQFIISKEKLDKYSDSLILIELIDNIFLYQIKLEKVV